MKLLDDDCYYTKDFATHEMTLLHKPTRLRVVRCWDTFAKQNSLWEWEDFKRHLKAIMANLIKDLDEDGQPRRICAHCTAPVEAAHYSMCKACWWERDPRNSSNMRAEFLQTLMDNMLPHCDAGHKGCTTVHQSSGLFIDDEKESMYIRELEYWRSTWNCSLDEAAARCYTNEYSVTRFKMWLETLFVDIVY